MTDLLRAAVRGVVTLIAFLGPPPEYLDVALTSAAACQNDVVLVGDDRNRRAWKRHWDSDRVRLPKLEAFLSVYTKMSDYQPFYERAFWWRPFAVLEWMHREGVREIFLLDGDIVSFADYSRDLCRRCRIDARSR